MASNGCGAPASAMGAGALAPPELVEFHVCDELQRTKRSRGL